MTGYLAGEEVITSPANPTIRRARALQRRRVRERERALLVEGIRAIETAIDNGVVLQLLILDARRASQLPEQALARMRAATGRVVLAADVPFHSITETEHPQPVIAVCALPELRVPRASTLVLALDAVRDPGNLGTLIRSAAAVGVDVVALLPGCVDAYNSKSVRASAGQIFALPIARVASASAAADEFFAARPTIVVADASGEQRYDAHDWTARTLLVVGGEATGASSESRTYADEIVSIPIAPGVESLNAAVAGSVLLFEAARQRRTGE